MAWFLLLLNRPTQLGLFRKKKVCLGLQFWETKGMDGTGFCKARGRGHVQLELRGWAQGKCGGKVIMV